MTSISVKELVDKAEALPKLPDTTMQLIRVINDPNSSLKQIIDTIRYDQAVTTELLRLCNSAYWGLSRTIASLDDAVRMIGTSKLMHLVLAAHTHALLSPEQSGYGLRPGGLWQHSVGVALGCQVVAEQFNVKEKGLAFTAGLLHDIGKVVLNETVRSEYARIVRMVEELHIPFVEAEQRVIGITHAELGGMLASRWGLPDPLPDCIRYHYEPSAAPEPNTTIDIVHLADMACLLMGVGGGDDAQMYKVDGAVLEQHGICETDVEMVGAAMIGELKHVQKLFGSVA